VRGRENEDVPWGLRVGRRSPVNGQAWPQRRKRKGKEEEGDVGDVEV
jgi:hypothetical protein